MSVAIHRAIYRQTSWTRWAKVLVGLFFSVLLTRDAAANCPNGATSQSVTTADNLTQLIESSRSPCTLNVGPGTYDAGFDLETQGSDFIFRISSPITIKSTAGAASTTLRVASGIGYTVVVQALQGKCPSGATLDGFTITGGLAGVLVQTVQTGICPLDQITNVTLRNLVISTDSGAQGGNGILFGGVQSSVIDSCTITTAKNNGIFLSGGSNNNIVMNNTIANTVSGHAIAVQGSNDNVVVANNITGSGFDGIILNSSVGPSLSGSGSSRNRIERNTINNHRIDGITLADASSFNYVGLNSAKPIPGQTNGVGIWVNNASNGSYLFGNDVSGSPEVGFSLLTSKSTYVQANSVHGNKQGGIWVANYQFSADNSSPVPRDTVIQNNNVYFNPSGGQVLLEGTTAVDVAYNHLSGEQSGTLAGNNTTGVYIHESDPAHSLGGIVTSSSSVNLYENTITDVNNRAVVNATTMTTQFFRNRFLNGSNDPLVQNGRQGLTYSYTGADVQWDASRFLGGSHWSEYSIASGNPDPAHPYRGFIYDNTHGIDGNGPYVDKFPYQSEHLGAPYATYSVNIVEPVAGSVLAAGTTKTVRWVARGCVRVDLYYDSAVLAQTRITPPGGYPNVGHYFWTVPATAPFRADYGLRVVCLDSKSAPVGVSADSAFFTIAATDLVLMNPGRGFRAVNGGTVRVAWKKSTAVGNVDVFVKSGTGAETQIASSLSGTWADIPLPASVSSSSQVTIRIQDSGSSSRQDSVDGSFMVRGGTPSFTTALAGLTLQMGAIQLLEWVGMSSSYFVDLDLYENGSLARSIVKNLPDFGNYTWFVPEMWSPGSTIHATFKNANGVTVGQIDSGTFRVFYKTDTGVLVDRYRLYNLVTQEHLFTTDLNEFNVLGTRPDWLQEGVASKMHNGPVNTGGVDGVPYYRLYDFISRWHHWTTDRNEYFTLRAFTGRYLAEGVDGYIFKSQVAGTTPWYRLTLPGIPGLHTWTKDQNERDILVNERGWVEEQKEYVFP